MEDDTELEAETALSQEQQARLEAALAADDMLRTKTTQPFGTVSTPGKSEHIVALATWIISGKDK